MTKTDTLDLNNLPTDNEWSFGDQPKSATTALTHSYHRYPAKFIPQIVTGLMQRHTKRGDLVVDPFGGCGTTLVEAKLGGRNSVGLDINPIAKLITQTKVTAIKPDLLEASHKHFMDAYENKPARKINYHPKISYWFGDKELKSLSKIYGAIGNIPDHTSRRFYLCAFSHNLKTSSRWLTKSIKPTIDPNKNIEDPFRTFMRHLNGMAKKNRQFYGALSESGNLDTSSLVYKRDATKNWGLDAGGIDLIVTSPPYVTSYEYAYLHQLPLLWFGSDPKLFNGWHKKFSGEVAGFKSGFIGASAQPGRRVKLADSPVASSIVNDLSGVNQPLARDVANYFIDMKAVFGRMLKNLKPRGVASIIIGNTTMAGVRIKNAEFVVEQMGIIGFDLVDVVKRKLSNKLIAPWRDSKTGKFTSPLNPNGHRVYEYEYILVMRKPSKI